MWGNIFFAIKKTSVARRAAEALNQFGIRFNSNPPFPRSFVKRCLIAFVRVRKATMAVSEALLNKAIP
jgi:hypothetical protein